MLGSDGHPVLSRAEAARRLGISVSGIRRLQAQGVLVGKKDRQGWYRFEQTEVARVALERAAAPRQQSIDGRLAALVFADADEGFGLSDIVKRREISPRLVRQLLRERLDGGDVVIPCAEARAIERILHSRYPQGFDWAEFSAVIADLCEAQDVTLAKALYKPG